MNTYILHYLEHMLIGIVCCAAMLLFQVYQALVLYEMGLRETKCDRFLARAPYAPKQSCHSRVRPPSGYSGLQIFWGSLMP